MPERTLVQMDDPLPRDQSGVPCCLITQAPSPSLSLQQKVDQYFLCNQIPGLCFMGENSGWRLAAYNRFLWLLFQVGGELGVEMGGGSDGWMSVREILHCPLVL